MNWTELGAKGIKAYYKDEWVFIIHADCRDILPLIPDKSIDLVLTDPPYGIGFMGKDWDKALPDKEIWCECFRVLQDGAFAFVMSIPRADCLSRMIISLEDAGFMVNFTPIFWAYASGFPKAQNIGKAMDKRLGAERNRELKFKTDIKSGSFHAGRESAARTMVNIVDNEPITPQAKALDGSYGGFQPKPAVEVIIVAMKPLSEKTFVDQALKNRKGISWLDDGRIPTNWENDPNKRGWQGGNTSLEFVSNTPIHPACKPGHKRVSFPNSQGRFPANLLVSDDVLNDGKVTKSTGGHGEASRNWQGDGHTISMIPQATGGFGDTGSFSRYFDLDKWAQKTFPFLIVPKASKSEKNRGCEGLETKEHWATNNQFTSDPRMSHKQNRIPNKNYHPTVKPLKLMSYLITLGSREGDTVLDPFLGSGTTTLACKLLNRKCIGVEIEERYAEIAANRCRQGVFNFERL